LTEVGPTPPAPLIVVGPVAVSVKALATAAPPWSFVTVFNSVSDAGWSWLVNVQVTFSPLAIASPLAGFISAAPVQDSDVYV
jgi:hypothetical protein